MAGRGDGDRNKIKRLKCKAQYFGLENKPSLGASKRKLFLIFSRSQKKKTNEWLHQMTVYIKVKKRYEILTMIGQQSTKETSLMQLVTCIYSSRLQSFGFGKTPGKSLCLLFHLSLTYFFATTEQQCIQNILYTGVFILIAIRLTMRNKVPCMGCQNITNCLLPHPNLTFTHCCPQNVPRWREHVKCLAVDSSLVVFL